MMKNDRDIGDLTPDAVARRERRKVRARRVRRDNVWFGLGMFGLVGWAVSIPMVAGLAIGVAIDASSPGRYSWTLMLLVIGVLVGCLNAWYWISRQRREIERDRAEEEDFR